MNENKSIIKPCPFCGSLDMYRSVNQPNDFYCSCTHSVFSEEEWNDAYCWKEIDKLKKENSWLKAWRKVARKWWREAKEWEETRNEWMERAQRFAKEMHFMNIGIDHLNQMLKEQNELMLAHSKLLNEYREKYIAAREELIEDLDAVIPVSHGYTREDVEAIADMRIEKRVEENRK